MCRTHKREPFPCICGSEISVTAFLLICGGKSSSTPFLGRSASAELNYLDFESPRFLLLLPAFFNAMATAYFWGFPAFISVLMFELTVLRKNPF
jgi:hypothetical protein